MTSQGCLIAMLQMSKPRIKEVMLPPEDSKASKFFPGLLAAYDWK